MPAAVYVGDGQIEVQHLDVPEPGPDEVLVEISDCGICGTDLHLVLDRYARPGDILGHEWSGTVIGIEGASTVWQPGSRVVGNPTPGCGRCRACEAGRPSVCLKRPPPDFLSWHGAFCRYMTVKAERLTRIPETLSIRDAALTEPTAIAVHVVNMAAPGPDDRILVTGAGPVGLLTIAVLRSRGITDITVSEPSELRREHALLAGAVSAISPDDLAPAPMGRTAATAYSLVFECSGNARAIEIALDQLDYAGTLVLAGTGHDLPRLNHNRMIVMELSVVGAYNYDAAGFAPALDLLASGSLDTNVLISGSDVGLDELLPTMHRLSRGEIAGKVLVQPVTSVT
ncbi:MAG: alcohol dehydrogenase catalytic domain-containing protein [Acidimicrobiales bacterium]|jgi:(R,R)-butanediol dehydrogenase / meso-butanediol dehydrogenase / diacetyl reductase